MNTTMRHTIWIFLLAISAMQALAVNYQPFASSAAVTPSAQFHSTSVYSNQWGPQESILNDDGSVNTGAYMGSQSNAPSGPRRVGGQSGTPGGGGTQQPIGDAIIPLLLMAAGYMVYRLRRRRKMVP